MENQNQNKRYRILVRNLSGKIISFNVDEFRIEDGLVIFYDTFTKTRQRFAVSNCEIKENIRGVSQ